MQLRYFLPFPIRKVLRCPFGDHQEVKMSEPNSAITLLCQLVDNGFYQMENIFSVRISPKLYVSEVKESILPEIISDVRNIRAHTLELWQPIESYRISGDDVGDSTVESLLAIVRRSPKTVAKLNPTFLVSDYFVGSPPPRHLHLLVQAPVSGVGGTNPLSPLHSH